MLRKLLLLSSTLVVAVAATLSTAQAQSSAMVKNDGVNLDYIAGDSHLYIKYSDNASALSKLNSIATEAAYDVARGEAYYIIFSFLPKSQAYNAQAINQASVQGSVARAQLKLKYGVGHDKCVFVIDTTLGLQNMVRIQKVDGRIQSSQNQTINYTTSTKSSAIVSAVAKYNGNVPYVDFDMYMARYDMDYISDCGQLFSNEESTAYQSSEQPVEQEYSEPVETKPQIEESYIPYVEEEYAFQKEFKPVFGLQTNLLYWAVANPNLGIEFFMGSGVSLAFEGQYSLLADIIQREDRCAYLWNVDAELKFWTNTDGMFSGLYVGLIGGVGQYDIKFSEYGNQGEYFTAGLTLGYSLPLTEKFGMEFGLAGGYVGYLNKEYTWNGEYNIATQNEMNDKYQWKILPTKAEVSLVWKF